MEFYNISFIDSNPYFAIILILFPLVLALKRKLILDPLDLSIFSNC